MATKWVSEVANEIVDLIEASDNVFEEHYRISIEGKNASETVTTRLKSIFKLCEENFLDCPILISRGESLSRSDLDDLLLLKNDDWRFVFSKEGIAKASKYRDCENTVFYFLASSLVDWFGSIDPLDKSEFLPLDLTSPTTFIINGLHNGFGGSVLWFLPATATKPDLKVHSLLPEEAIVHSLVHVISNKQTCISPRTFEILWGEVDPRFLSCINNVQAKVYAACLVQDIRKEDEGYEVILKGTKRLRLRLCRREDVISEEAVAFIKRAVEWVYAERPETRLKLIMDRLSIDISEKLSLVSGMIVHIDAAIQQAKDSYSYVILERKDEYHKELRELMKDMKSQSEIYASKVRNLVTSLTRDTLGVLVLIGFSFIGKFDAGRIGELLISDELSLLTKFISIYLLISCTIQLIVHWRDSTLTFKESQEWLGILQNYTSLEDSRSRFTKPLEKRRFTLHLAMFFSAVFYSILTLVTWNLPFIINLLLNQR